MSSLPKQKEKSHTCAFSYMQFNRTAKKKSTIKALKLFSWTVTKEGKVLQKVQTKQIPRPGLLLLGKILKLKHE